MISVRKLAALDIALHGEKLIVGEFIVGTLGIAIFGIFSFVRGEHGVGIYLMTLALNYLPLLIYALIISSRKSAEQEVAGMLVNQGQIVKYSMWQILILVPFAIVLLTFYQELRFNMQPMDKDL